MGNKFGSSDISSDMSATVAYIMYFGLSYATPFHLASITETERRSNGKLMGNERESNGDLTRN